MSTGCAFPVAAQTYAGLLEPGDSSQLYDEYLFEGKESQELTILLEGEVALDTYLVVRASSGAEWTNDDYSDANISRIALIASETLSARCLCLDAGEPKCKKPAITATIAGPC